MSLFNNIVNSVISFFLREGSKNLPPDDFFKKIKDKRQLVTKEMIDNLKEHLASETKQFIDNGQVKSASRLLFHIDCIEREQRVIDAGLNQFVYRDDLDDFMTNVSNQVVKIIELENFERVIPFDKSKEINRVKNLFDQVYIVFTDYTGREERKVEKRKRANDPIAFGVFKTGDNRIWNHRFYFICDWEDEYCDLTLDKYVSQMVAKGYDTPVHEAVPITVEELKLRVDEARKSEKKISAISPMYHVVETVVSNDEQ